MIEENFAKYVSVRTEFKYNHWKVQSNVIIPQLGAGGVVVTTLEIDGGYSRPEVEQVALTVGTSVAKKLLELIG